MMAAGGGWVNKWTVDPVEVQAWLAAQAITNRQGPLPGFPRVLDLHLGEREAVITREYVRGAGERSLWPHDAGLISALQHAAQVETAGRMLNWSRGVGLGRALRSATLRSRPLLRPVDDALRTLHGLGVSVPDVRIANMGWVPGRAGQADRVVLVDPGRAPIEALSNARGEAWSRCPHEIGLSIAVARLLRKAPSYRACRIIDYRTLRKVMRAHGWRDAEIQGTAGFHTEPVRGSKDGDILLERKNAWALLHEMIHAAGVVDHDLTVWLTEGITEATAQVVAKHNGWKHVSTYPTEVAFVQRMLAPATGWSVLEIARAVVKNPRAAATTLGNRLAQQRGGHAHVWAKRLRRLNPQELRVVVSQARGGEVP